MVNKLAKTTLACLISQALSIATAHANETEVTIDTSQQFYIGGVSKLQREKFFNIHSNPVAKEFSEKDLLYIQNELNAGYGRSFWGPLSEAKQADNFPSTFDAQQLGEAKIASALSDPNYVYADRRTVATEHPSAAMRHTDLVEGARWAADYFDYYYDDETRPLFYEPMNEPFVHASEYVKCDAGVGAQCGWDLEANQEVKLLMSQWFREIGKAMDEKGLDTQVIGYSAAWPSYELNDFELWESSQKMFMDEAGEYMDAFSFHLYDGVNVTGQDNIRSGSNSEAIIDLVESYSHLSFGEVKPHAVTEYGGIVSGFGDEYTPEKASQELRSFNHILFSLLTKEDRILTSIPFITGIASWYYNANNFNPYSAVILRPDPDKIINGKVLDHIPTEKAKFFQLWANVKGNRVVINDTDPDLASQAFAYGDTLFVALNNYESGTKQVSLNFASQQGEIESTRIKRLHVPYGERAQYSDDTVLEAPTSLLLASNETVILEYQFAEPIEHQSKTQRDSYYSDNLLQPIVADTALEYEFNDVAIQQNSLSFADAISDYITFDESALIAPEVDVIDPENDVDLTPKQLAKAERKLARQILKAERRAERIENKFAKFESRFAKLVNKKGDEWPTTNRWNRLVEKATTNEKYQQAIHAHYAEHGYNDSTANALLRMSIGRKHDKSKQPIVKVNGHAIEVPNDWAGNDQINRDDFFGTIEIPFPAKYLKTNNNVSITFPDSEGRVSSVVLETSIESEFVEVPVSDVEIAQEALAINRDKPYRLKATTLPANATNQQVVWFSSDESVATVDKHGVVTPVSPGFVMISASDANEVASDSVQIEIRDQDTIKNTVVLTDTLQDLESSDQYQFNIQYSTDVERDIALEIHDLNNKWLTSSRVTVPAGNGTTSITINLDEPLPGGEGYRVIAAIREVGGGWQTNVDAHTIDNMSVESTYVVDETNLIGEFNPDFEKGSLLDWTVSWDTEGYVEVTLDAAQTGDYGLLVDTTSGFVGLNLSSDVLPQDIMTEGKKLKVSFYAKRIAGSGGAGGWTQFFNTFGDYQATPQGPWFWTDIVDEWVYFEKEIDGLDWADQDTHFLIMFRTLGQQWHIDNVRVDDITPAPVDDNILADVNADFENGDVWPWAEYWENDGSTSLFVSPLAAKDSDYGLHITSDGITNTGINMAPDVFPQDLGANQGIQYKLSFDVKSNSGKAVGWMRAVSKDSWATRIDTWFETTGDGSWKTVEIIRLDQDWSGFENGRFDLFFSPNPDNGTDVYIDNIRIEPVPVQP